MLQAQIFSRSVPESVAGMIAAVKAAGGRREGGHESYRVEFEDGSYWSAAVYFPEGRPAYYNGGPKIGGTLLPHG